MKKILSIMILSIVLISGCSITGNVLKLSLPPSATAKDLVPNEIPNYWSVPTDSLITAAAGYAAQATVGATIIDPTTAYKAGLFTSAVVSCYQEAGAVNTKGYIRKTDFYGGFIAVADENQITDPRLLWICVKEKLPTFSIYPAEELHPCSLKFTIETDYNKFYVLGWGLDTSVCQDICKNMMAEKTLNYDGIKCAQ